VKQSTQAAYRDAPFQLRGSSFTMMVLKLHDPADPNFLPQLAGKVRQAPNFFRNAPVVLDVDDMAADIDLDFGALVAALRSEGLVPVGLQGGAADHQVAAVRAGLALLPAGRTPRQEPARAGAAPPAAAPAGERAELPFQRTTLTITEPVRSGRQIYAQNGDLVVTASVSPGAELVADGSIHVYGALRGRAIAGISGNRDARIFCQSLEAELVSIAGLYRVSEDIDKSLRRKQVHIHLDKDFLHIDPVTL
jgi:septum site-determining protein MinC